MKSKPKLLMLMFFLHVYKTSPAAPSIDESEVKSFVLERKAGHGTDYFTVNMKSGRTDGGTVHSWCRSLEAYQDTGKSSNQSSYSCLCHASRYSFITPMQKCIDATTAAIFGGCENYFNRGFLLSQHPVDLTKKSNSRVNNNFLQVSTADSCSLFGNNTYFSYSGFQCKWETIDNGFFFLDSQGYVSWKKDDTLSPKLSGRIIRLVVKCSSNTKCFLFKSLGKTPYYGPVRSSTSSSHPPVANCHVGSHVSLLPTTSSLSSSPPTPPPPSPLSSSSSESSSPSTLLSSTSSSAPHPPLSSSASSALSPSVMLSSRTGTLGVPPSFSSFLTSTQSEITRLPILNTGKVLSTSKAGLQSLLPIKSNDATDISTWTPYSSTNTVTYPTEPSKTTTVVSSSSAAGVVPGNSGTRTGGNDNGVIIGTAVGGAVVLGIFIIIIIVFWKRRKAWESTEKQTKPVKNPVYGSSENAIQLEAPKGSKTMPSITQDNQPTYQSLIDDNGKSNGAAIYSSADDEYDNCTIYQSLDKQIPGTPVYGRLNEGLPEPAHSTGLPKPKPKAKTSVAGIPTSKANGVTGIPKPKPTTTGKPSNRPIVAHENVYIVLDGPGTGQGTPPEPLYNVLEGTDSGQDYEAPTVDLLYNVLEVPDPRQDTPNNGPSTTQDPLYNVLEGPDAKNATSDRQDPGNDPLYNVLEGPEASHVAYESGTHTAQEPLYNVLDGPDAEKSPVVTQGTAGPSNEPLYNVLDGPDSDGSKQGAPKEPISPEAHDNPAYEQTLAFDTPYAAVHRPSMQRESVYEPLRGPGQDLYESIG